MGGLSHSAEGKSMLPEMLAVLLVVPGEQVLSANGDVASCVSTVIPL